ncbi:5-oxoprolinase-like isoform X1 [Montipora capricornis]|uniref:5-oxoprolinase-like isoform X1 n=1 Tax=Montipora capricornis TaxID=246305 RepID=UPI0035F10246
MSRQEESRLRGKFRFAIDRGGTFTDVYSECPNGKVRVMKLLSVDPAYPDAPREGIRRIMEQVTGIKMPADQPIDPEYIEWIRMGTTVATNALLERKGERMTLVITQGFHDLLHIGNQTRPNIFDLKVICPEVLHEDIIVVKGRLVLVQPDSKIQRPENCKIVTGSTGEKLEEWEPLDKDQLRIDLQRVLDKGIKSLAVVLMHSYMYNVHEKEVGDIALEMGFEQVSLSSTIMPMVRIVPRGYTASADAYLTPCIKKYIQGFTAGFQKGIENKVLFMQSDGGLTPVAKFYGSRAILSGPAGGVVGYAMTTFQRETDQPVIGFDMGGTSTDVSRFAGQYEHVFETTTAGITIQAPQLDINTVAAGGGSRLFFRAGLFVVGPESASAHPGPVCYRKGGPLAVTDANLVLGRILPEFFPKIFGKTEDLPLDFDGSWAAFKKLTEEVNKFLSSQSDGDAKKEPLSIAEVAMGFITVANETMCRPIRALTEARGHDTARHVLACFGGAGGQHACSIARSLGMSTVFIHRYAGILSAYGLALADVVHEAQEPCAREYNTESFSFLDERIDFLTEKCIKELKSQGFEESQISTEAFLHMRYSGTDCALMCSASSAKPDLQPSTACRHGDFGQAFNKRYIREFGFTIPSRQILIDDIRVRGTGHSKTSVAHEVPAADTPPPVKKVTKCYFEDGFHQTKIYLLEELAAGHSIDGPAVIVDNTSTILVEPQCKAVITKSGDITIEIGGNQTKKSIGTELDAIQLSIFSHRFMSTAEQMGRVLQRTSISTNIKERLDFSCAMFGPDGGLVANAPHIPVHLGSMQETVQYQIRTLGNDLKEGDVILSNHPSAGGTHLPDLTVITPVFHPGQSKPVFYVASRGHHADIGGSAPGSMPPDSHSIFEEGAVFRSFKIVKEGVFQEEGLVEKLMEPAKYPGCSGTRNLHDNLSDLKAQIAANHKGIKLISGLIEEYSLPVVQAYMKYIQHNAEVAVREMLKEIATKTKERTGKTILFSEDFMDDGSRIKLTIFIDEEEGSAVFDFTGTGPEMYGNCNAPRAITFSAIIYCLRCMVKHDIPLNQGCLAPVKVLIPPGSILDPTETAAVVGGNVLTSQRVVDVVLKAFEVCAASQGCMNNTTFGDEGCGYYETICGGSGAGPTWDGRSGVHVHMTNTRITDPEIIERRFPVILRRFHLNPGTGGTGFHKGGDGVVRELLFRKAQVLSVLSERRAFRPYGMNGGEPGSPGLNLLLKADGRIINLGGKASVNIKPGDCYRVQTPGGGGYGEIPGGLRPKNDVADPPTEIEQNKQQFFAACGSLHNYKMMQDSA